MPSRTGGIGFAAVGLLAVLAAINLLFAPDTRDVLEARTTLGHGPAGQAALVDLLSELDHPVARSYRPPDAWPEEAVVWLIDPAPRPSVGDGPVSVIEAVSGWVEAGGTALVFGGAGEDWTSLGLETTTLVEAEALSLEPGPRRIELDAPVVFTDPGRHEVLLRDTSGHAFAVVATMGRGRLVAVSDARFLQNRHLAEADAAVLALDLVRRFGSPVFDEGFHGLHAAPGFWELIGVGRIVLFSLCLAALALAAARWLAPWPPRRHATADAPEAALSTFVDALASHYAKTSEHADAFRAYRDGLLHRLRRHSRSAGRQGDAAFMERLAGDSRLEGETRAFLVDGELPAKRGGMMHAARLLERFAQERS